MKRDLLARALFSPSKVIDAAMMDRSIAWCNHQLELRALLWPEDAGTPVERMERKILDVLTKRLDKVLHEHPGITKETAVEPAGYQTATWPSCVTLTAKAPGAVKSTAALFKRWPLAAARSRK